MLFQPDSDRIMFSFKGKDITYEQLHSHIGSFSNVLSLREKDRAILFAENRPEWVYSFYAILKKKGVAVTLDMTSNQEDVEHVLKDSQPSVVFCSDKTQDILMMSLNSLGMHVDIINMDQVEKTGDHKVITIDNNPDDTAVIIYTSGTTGAPKGVMLSYRNMKFTTDDLVKMNYIRKDDIILGFLPFHHIFALQANILVPLSIGARTVMIDNITSEALLRAVQTYHVSIFPGVPRLYRMLMDGMSAKIRSNMFARLLFALSRAVGSYALGKLLFSSVQKKFGGNIRFFVSGGSKLDDDILYGFRALGFKILNAYGLTEAGPLISHNSPDDIKFGTVGKIIRGVDVKIENGEILAKGPGIMQGYFNNPDATNAVIKDGWFHTGDKGEVDENGYLYITGRIKDIIVLPNGKNINPDEIEKKILGASALIKEIGVFQSGDNLHALVVPDMGEIQNEGIVNISETLRWTIIDRYNQSVPSYRRISHIFISKEELPKTKLGKTRRFMLPEIARHTEMARDHVTEAEPTFHEYELLKKHLISLGQEKVFASAHLELDLGLDSLDKVELLAFIEKTFGLKMDEKKLSGFHDIKGLALYLEEHKQKIDEETQNWSEILKENVSVRLPDRITLLAFVKCLFIPLSKLYFRLEGKGVENIPSDRPFIMVPNHQSFLDGLFVVRFIKKRILKNTYFFAKEKHFKTFWRRWGANNGNIVIMSLNNDLKTTIQKVGKVLKEGKNLVIFPEGARSRDGSLMPFKKTFAILAKELNISVVPVAIQGAYTLLPWGKKFPRPGKVRVEFMRPILPEHMDYDTIVMSAREMIREKVYIS